MRDVRELAAGVVERARRLGADAADVYVVEDHTLSVEVRDGRIETLENAGSIGLGLRVFREGATALASTRDLSPDAIEQLLGDALMMAALTDKDAHAGLPDAAELGVFGGELEMWDPAVEGLSLEARRDFAAEMEAAGRAADPRIKNCSGARWKDRRSQVTLANSHGFVGSYAGTSAYCGVAFIAGEGEEKQNGAYSASARHLGDLPSAGHVGREAASRAVRRLGPRELDSGTMTVVFDPDTAADLLKILAQAACASDVYRRASFLVGKQGECIGHSRLTMVDDPTVRRGLASRPFDGEGIGSRRTTLVQEGRLMGWLADSWFGRKLGVPSTGSAHRGFGSAPAVGFSNLRLTPGDRSPEEIYREVGDGVLITRLFWVGTNPVTGDLSRGAEGIRIERGQLTYPVHEITVAGNLLDMMGRVALVGNDAHPSSAIQSRTLAIEGVMVGGH